jgi:hypothetical protein
MNDLTAVIRQAERHGLRYEQGRKHAKLRDPRTNRCISISGTPSCQNAHKRVLRDVRKYLGVELTP